MQKFIYLRFLNREDIKRVYSWRKADIWKFTKFDTSNLKSLKNEYKWFDNLKKNELRFAIIVRQVEKKKEFHIGNVQLTNINKNIGFFHIFIGDKKYQSLGYGTIATKLLIQMITINKTVKKITLEVHRNNKAAIKIYSNLGFVFQGKQNRQFFKMYKKI